MPELLRITKYSRIQFTNSYIYSNFVLIVWIEIVITRKQSVPLSKKYLQLIFKFLNRFSGIWGILEQRQSCF